MSDRDALFQSANDPTKKRVWGAPQETEETRNLDNNGVVSLQKKKMDEQDKILDILGESIGRTKQIAVAIGNETEEQMGLLEDIDERVDKTTARVKNTTRRVERVEAKADTKCMWVTICILLLALIGVSFMAIYIK